MDKIERQELRREGVITEALPSANFRVHISDNDPEVMAHLAGKLRLHKIKILPGDRVIVEVSPYDNTKGRIVYRSK